MKLLVGIIISTCLVLGDDSGCTEDVTTTDVNNGDTTATDSDLEADDETVIQAPDTTDATTITPDEENLEICTEDVTETTTTETVETTDATNTDAIIEDGEESLVESDVLPNIEPETVPSDDVDPVDETAEEDNNGTTVAVIPENHITCICPLVYDPVCGSDGVSYSNACVLNCVSTDRCARGLSSIHMMYKGECRDLPCECPPYAQPVCGTNNQTYLNTCFLNCYNSQRGQRASAPIQIAYRGVCVKPSCVCPDSIIPLCGTDGRTYRNLCILQCFSWLHQARRQPPVHVQSAGACKEERCVCRPIKEQICASDGNTYYNQCSLNCQNRRRNHLGLNVLSIHYQGECKKCICPLNVDPVCVSDGNTYINYCLLECENKNRRLAGQHDLTVRWRGSCDCGCTKEWNPVCDSDLKTWGNRCQLDCENKKRLLNGQAALTMLHSGECSYCNCFHCSGLYAPVCGSDRQTYGNSCMLKCQSDCRVATKQLPIWKIKDGACC